MKKLTLILVYIVILQVVTSQIISLDIKVLLEGPFNGAEMNTKINAEGLFPFVQPFNQAPWNYTGSVSDIPDPGIVDWVLIELRETTGNSSTAIPETIIAQQACLLDKMARSEIQMVSTFSSLNYQFQIICMFSSGIEII